jgi:GT2 family glycosyltransferase
VGKASSGPEALVDVITSVYGAIPLVQRMIVSTLLAVTIPYELWLVDDKPGDEEQNLFFGQLEASLPPYMHVVRNKENLGFGPSNNAAAAKGGAPFILFLNSDAEPTEGFLSRMLLNMLDPGVGVVGAKLLFAEGSPHGQFGTVQHCGVFRTPYGEPYHAWVGAAPYDPRANRWQELDCVTGACMLIRRPLFEELGGFDPIFAVGAFEDVDLQWRARKAGWEVVYDPGVVVYHYFAGSGKEITHRRSGENKRILLERWGSSGVDLGPVGP